MHYKMNYMSYYYILKHLPSEHQDMLDGARVLELSHNFLRHPKEVGEGPYEDLKSLKKNSEIYRNLLKTNPKRAEKIFKDPFLLRGGNVILGPIDMDDRFHQMIYRIMQHSSNGRVTKNNVSGIHLYDKEKIRIERLIKKDEKTGVFVADISVKRSSTGEYVRKDSQTTFFPIDWNLQRLVFECHHAYKNMKEIKSSIYHGYTESGILLEFVFGSENRFLSVYPILE